MPDVLTFTVSRPNPRLMKLREGWSKIVAQELTRYAFMCERTAKQSVSGPVLRVQTGRLRSSITSRIETHGSSVFVFLGSNVVYARAHEFGATIPPRVIVPVVAKALRWETSGGVIVFARRARIPAFTLPARPYLMPALRKNIPAFFENLAARFGDYRKGR